MKQSTSIYVDEYALYFTLPAYNDLMMESINHLVICNLHVGGLISVMHQVKHFADTYL